MDQTTLVQTIFIMFNGLSHTLQKERPRSHRQNEQPRYHRLEQRMLSNQDPTNKMNDLDITIGATHVERSRSHQMNCVTVIFFFYKYNACIVIIYTNSQTHFLSFSYIPL